MEIQSQFAEIDGQRMHYLKAGAGPPLLLIHGLLGGSFCWRFNLPEFAANNTTYAVDLAGLGLSDAAPGADCSMAAQVRLLLRFLEINQLDEMDVVGSSWGGGVALQLAAQSARVRSLVLAAPVNPWSALGSGRLRFFGGRMGGLLVRYALPLSGGLHSWALERMYGDPRRISAGTLEGYSALAYRQGRGRALENILRNWGRDLHSVGEAVARVKAPALLVWGEEDRAVDPRSAQELERALPGCECRLLAGVGHLPFEEVPEVFNRLVLEFVERTA